MKCSKNVTALRGTVFIKINANSKQQDGFLLLREKFETAVKFNPAKVSLKETRGKLPQGKSTYFPFLTFLFKVHVGNDSLSVFV